MGNFSKNCASHFDFQKVIEEGLIRNWLCYEDRK